MAHPTTSQGTHKVLWAYAYQIEPPRPESQLGDVGQLLHGAGTSSRLDLRTWQGRFVLEPHVTHILVVSDSPAQDDPIHRSVEAELKRLGAPFSLTVPLAVTFPPSSSDDGSLAAS